MEKEKDRKEKKNNKIAKCEKRLFFFLNISFMLEQEREKDQNKKKMKMAKD